MTCAICERVGTHTASVGVSTVCDGCHTLIMSADTIGGVYDASKD